MGECEVSKKPDVAGIYKVSGFNLSNRRAYAIVEVAMVDGELRSNLHECNSDHETDDWMAISDHGNFTWSYIGTKDAQS